MICEKCHRLIDAYREHYFLHGKSICGFCYDRYYAPKDPQFHPFRDILISKRDHRKTEPTKTNPDISRVQVFGLRSVIHGNREHSAGSQTEAPDHNELKWDYECQTCATFFSIQVPSAPREERTVRCLKCRSLDIRRIDAGQLSDSSVGGDSHFTEAVCFRKWFYGVLWLHDYFRAGFVDDASIPCWQGKSVRRLA